MVSRVVGYLQNLGNLRWDSGDLMVEQKQLSSPRGLGVEVLEMMGWWGIETGSLGVWYLMVKGSRHEA